VCKDSKRTPLFPTQGSSAPPPHSDGPSCTARLARPIATPLCSLRTATVEVITLLCYYYLKLTSFLETDARPRRLHSEDARERSPLSDSRQLRYNRVSGVAGSQTAEQSPAEPETV